MQRDPAVANVYARALLGAARRVDKIAVVFEQAGALRRIFLKDIRLSRFLESPRINKEEKHALVDRIFKGRIEALLLNLIHVMLRNNRIENLAETLRLVLDLVDEERGVIPAVVTSAVPLTDDQKRLLHRTLEERLGLRFDIRYRVDPNILGGLVFKYRDREIDGSLKFDLQKIRDRLNAIRIN